MAPKRRRSRGQTRTSTVSTETVETEKSPRTAAVVVDEDEWPDEPELKKEPVALPTLVVTPSEDVGIDEVECSVVISIQVPESETVLPQDGASHTLERTSSGRAMRAPADVCCVVDISKSMASAATYEEEGVVKNDGLSYLDVVKHAVKSVIHMLHGQDRFALVAFDDIAEIAFPLEFMTPDGQTKAIAALEGLHPRGRTNIWGGVFVGMEAIRGPSKAGFRQKTILLLTDGQPNKKLDGRAAPKGHVHALRAYKEKHPDFQFQMNTFGFGYNLNSSLLLDLAVEAQGTFAFIPDALIVGTAFVSCISNVLSTQTQNAMLHLTPRNGATFVGNVLGIGPGMVSQASWGRVVRLGPLQFGLSRNVVVNMNIPVGSDAYLEATLVYSSLDGTMRRVSVSGCDRQGRTDALVAVARSDTVTTGYHVINVAESGFVDTSLDAIGALAERVATYAQQSQPNSIILAPLQEDVQVRMTKALTGAARFHRWGKHYLRAITRAHQLQLCTNFMDPGLQTYGGALFAALREEGDRIFLTLPAPVPAPKPIASGLSSFQPPGRRQLPVAIPPTTARQPSVNADSAPPKTTPEPTMNTYYAGCGGGCFGETGSVMVVGKGRTLVPEVRVGDLVRASNGVATVRCVVRIARPSTKKLITFVGGLAITPRHPVRFDGSWQLPRDLSSKMIATSGGYVYNFVLDKDHVLIVDGVECVTWGHGFKGPVVQHRYYGSDLVLKDLANMRGWKHGFVDVVGCLKNAEGQVVGLLDDRDVSEQVVELRGDRVSELGCRHAQHVIPQVVELRGAGGVRELRPGTLVC